MPNSNTAQTDHSGLHYQIACHTEYLSRKRIDCLDGLRAIGILAVVYQHTMQGVGRLGSSLFLLLSGYLVTTLLLRERSTNGTIDLGRVETRRYLRLFPLYFAVLATYVLLVWLFESNSVSRTQFFTNLPAFATLTSNLFVPKGEHVIFFFSWTMAAQEQFHFVWSRMLKYLGIGTSFAILCPILCVVYALSFLGCQPHVKGQSFLWTVILSLKPTLLLGALTAIVLDSRIGFSMVNRLIGFRIAPLVFLTAVMVVWRVKELPDGFMHLFLVALLASCVMQKSHFLSKLLQQPAFVFIGSVSFGIYLTHMLCLHAVAKIFHLAEIESIELQFVATFLLAVGVATVSDRYFESLFNSRKKAHSADSAGSRILATESGALIRREPKIRKKFALAPSFLTLSMYAYYFGTVQFSRRDHPQLFLR